MQFIDIHTHKKCCDENVLSVENVLSNQELPKTLCSVGIHPWYIPSEIGADLKKMEEMLSQPHCIALGECGLDKAIEIPLERQLEVLRKQLYLAAQLKRPVILHIVRAYQEIIALKKELQPHEPWVIHGFNKGKVLAESLVKHGFFLSFGQALLVNSTVQDTFAAIPLESCFLETDDAAITIESVYAKAALLKGLSETELRRKIYEQFQRIMYKI